MSEDIKQRLIRIFILPLVEDLGFTFEGNMEGFAEWLAREVGSASDYQISAARDDIARTTERTRYGKLAFPDLKRSSEAIKSQPVNDPRRMRSEAPMAMRANGRTSMEARAAKMLDDYRNGHPALRRGMERTMGQALAIAERVLDAAERRRHRVPRDMSSMSDAERADFIDRVFADWGVTGINGFGSLRPMKATGQRREAAE